MASLKNQTHNGADEHFAGTCAMKGSWVAWPLIHVTGVHLLQLITCKAQNACTDCEEQQSKGKECKEGSTCMQRVENVEYLHISG